MLGTKCIAPNLVFSACYRRKEPPTSLSSLTTIDGGASLDSSNSDSFPDSLLNDDTVDKEKMEGVSKHWCDAS